MSSDPLSLSMDDASQVWSLVEQQIDAFCTAWDNADSPPDLAEFVGEYEPAVRRLILLDLVKMDLEFRSSNPDWIQPIEDYVAAWPELAPNDVVPAELLYEDIYHRRLQGETVEVADYLRRFPQSAETLKRLLGTDGAEVSTALSQGKIDPAQFHVGDTVDDFELRVELGRGAFGVVFLAIQRSMQRMVALKISANRGTEAQVLAQLEHPNIVRVYDRRVMEEKDLQLFYMQYVRGGTLQGALKYARGRERSDWNGKLILEAIDRTLDDHGEVIPAPTPARISLGQSDWLKATCDVGIQLASALDHAHQKNTLHRDIKPANILLTVDGVAKLADFNISCSSKVDGASPAAYFGGSLAYMSPEQLEAYNPHHERMPDSLDARSDIYSTAVVVWEMLTGARPFGDEQLGSSWETTLDEMTARRSAGLTAKQWKNLPDSCPSALRQFFEKALAPSPDDRFANSADTIRLLRIAGSAGEESVSQSAAWIKFARRYPFVLMTIAAVVPNAMAALFVYDYNGGQLPEKNHGVFWVAQAVINGIFFPIGVLLVVRFTWPLAQALKARRQHVSISTESQEIARNRSLNLGRVVLFIGLFLWSLAGIVYPLALVDYSNLGSDSGLIADFSVSHLLGGLLAGSYPFFFITFVGLVAWYPTFLETSVGDDGTEARLLKRTATTVGFVEKMAAALPMLAVLLLVFDGGQHQKTLGILSVASLLGFGLIFWMSRAIRKRVEQLLAVLQPDDGAQLG